MEYFYTIFSTTGDYNLYFRKRENHRETGLINCSSFELSTFLKANDYSLKSINTPSKILSKIPIEFHSYFLLGWSDGDGCFYYNDKKNLIQYIVSGSFEQDWESLIKLCEYLEINYKIDRFKSGQNKYSRFLIHRNNDIIKFGNFIYRDCDIGLPRKIFKFNEIKKYIMERNSTRFSCYDRQGNFVMEFNSLKSASDWINRGRYVGSSIKDCIIGRQPTAYGYTWKKSNIYDVEF